MEECLSLKDIFSGFEGESPMELCRFLDKCAKPNMKLCLSDVQAPFEVGVAALEAYAPKKIQPIAEYKQDLELYPKLTSQEQTRLFNCGEKDRLIESSLYVVLDILPYYVPDYDINNVLECSMGIVECYNHYDCNLNVSFSLFAAFFVRQTALQILREREQDMYADEMIKKVIDAYMQLKSNGEKIDSQIIGAKAGVSPAFAAEIIGEIQQALENKKSGK